MDIEKLFRPLKIKSTNFPNRVVMAPMTTISGNPDGSFSDQEIAYLEQRAQSEVGTIITPACYVHPYGQAFANQVGCHTDAMIRSLSDCAEAIKKHGSVALLQIHHGGNAAKEKFTGRPPLAPSAVLNRRGTSELPQAMTEAEIWETIEAFAEASLRAEKAGFDGVQIHGANTYLVQQFFSPFTNKRNDQWGGESQHSKNKLENRSRFAREIIKAIREKVSADFLIAYRISPEESEPLGYSVFDAIGLLKILIPYGIDLLDISSIQYGKGVRGDYSSGTHPTYLIKDALPYMPVIGVGGVSSAEEALRVMDEGVEFVAMGKQLLLDKDWVLKIKNGQNDSIRTAITKDEIALLDLPERMKDYLKKFY